MNHSTMPPKTLTTVGLQVHSPVRGLRRRIRELGGVVLCGRTAPAIRHRVRILSRRVTVSGQGCGFSIEAD